MLVFIWMIYGLVFFDSKCFGREHSIAYRNPYTGNRYVWLVYILSFCAGLMLSAHGIVRWYCALNILALTITQVVKEYAFASA